MKQYSVTLTLSITAEDPVTAAHLVDTLLAAPHQLARVQEVQLLAVHGLDANHWLAEILLEGGYTIHACPPHVFPRVPEDLECETL